MDFFNLSIIYGKHIDFKFFFIEILFFGESWRVLSLRENTVSSFVFLRKFILSEKLSKLLSYSWIKFSLRI